MAVRPVQERLAARYGGTASIRMARAKAGPVVTDNGNLVTVLNRDVKIQIRSPHAWALRRIVESRYKD